MSNKSTIKILTAILGSSMFLFGVLKFVNPFKEWYTIQITGSGLSTSLYWLGIAGEIISGASLVLALIFTNLKSVGFRNVVYFSKTVIIVIMLTALYVHLQPGVPAEILPLQLKPPIFPVIFIVMSVWNMYLVKKSTQTQTQY